MKKKKVTQHDAEKMLVEKMNVDRLTDKVYQAVQELFEEETSNIEIECSVKPNDGGKYESDEAWYDDVRQEYFNKAWYQLEVWLHNS